MSESNDRLSYTSLILGLLLVLPTINMVAQGQPKEIVRKDARAVPVYSFSGLEPLLSSSSDTTFVINFWATWCAPCVEELPYFEELTRSAVGAPIKVILVSLDFRKQLASRLLPFLDKHDIRSTVLVLDDPRANDWINKVDPAWSGALPATLVFRGPRREFREQSFTREELFQLVQSFTE